MIGALAADASKWAEGWKLKFVIKKEKTWRSHGGGKTYWVNLLESTPEPRLICFFLLILRLWQIICSSEKFLLIENWSFLIQDSLPSPLDNTRNISRVFLPTANVLSCFVCHQFIASLCNRECFPVFFFNGKDGIECSLEFLYINISCNLQFLVCIMKGFY